MGAVSADEKQRDEDERELSETFTSPLEKCTGDQRRAVAAAPAEFSSHGGSRSPASWMSTAVAINVILLIAVVYNEWSSNQATKSFNYNATVGSVRSEICQAPAFTTSSQVVTHDPCSGHGIIEYEAGLAACRCHPCFTGSDCSTADNGCIVDAFQGDPTMFEKYWLQNGDSSTTVILGWQQLSYYANSKQFFFMQTELDQMIRSLHGIVGNAVTEGRHIVVGVGSSQLLQAALYALSSPSLSTPASVVSLAPFYSAYPIQTDYLRSGLYKWAGDAAKFKQTSPEDAYIELVTTPSNPTGEIRHPVVNGTGGALVHDLAYFWPHYVPIRAPADDELMLFTLSKSSGHAGTRIGWAIVKDLGVAKKMAKFIEINTIGVSKDAQVRATHILRSVTLAYERGGVDERTMSEAVEVHVEKQALFHFGASEMAYRWQKLRSALASGVRFSLLPEFQSSYCNFLKQMRFPTPSFAWLRCTQEDDCEKFLRSHGILTRGGGYFGADPSFVRISMVDRRSSFEILVNRLKMLEQS